MKNQKPGVVMWVWIASLSILGATKTMAESPLSKSQVIADSEADFSGQQGEKNWFYGYWNQSADSDGIYAPNQDFTTFENFGQDPINGLSQHLEFTTGPLWVLEDGQYYTSLWARGGHAHADMPLGDHARANHWVIRRWVSDTEGSVHIKGKVGKVMPWGELWGGATQYRILVDGDVVFEKAFDGAESDYAVDVNLSPGMPVDFMIGPGPAIGVVTFSAVIEKTK